MSRSITIRLRVTPDERDELERRAGGAGRVSAWLRELALGEAVAPDGRAEAAARRDTELAAARGMATRHLRALRWYSQERRRVGLTDVDQAVRRQVAVTALRWRAKVRELRGER